MTEVAPKMFNQKKMNQIVEISNRNNANREYLAAHFFDKTPIPTASIMAPITIPIPARN